MLNRIAEKVINVIHEVLYAQCEKGFSKYGVSLDEVVYDIEDEPLDFNLMALEEAIDGMQYLAAENARLRMKIVNIEKALVFSSLESEEIRKIMEGK